ncbi:MAG: lipopolysaccharide transport periplasmic protein LptA [Pseudomonadota bacterium]
MNLFGIFLYTGMKHGTIKTLLMGMVMCLLLFWDGAENTLLGKTVSRVGILPFQIYSGEKVGYLQEVISTRLAQQLEKKAITTLAPEEVNRIIAGREASIFNPEELNSIAQKTGSQFLVYGSLTKIDDNLSIDARVFTPLKESLFYKDFVEGKDLDQLIEQLGSKISQQILAVALKETPLESAPDKPTILEEELQPDSSPGKSEPFPSPITPPVTSPVENEEAPVSETKASTPVEDSTSLVEEAPVNVASSVSEPPPVTPDTFPEETEADLGAGKKSSTSEKPFSSSQPINITSDRMEADNRNRTVNFLGNVVAKREDMVIFSDRLLTFYNKEGKIDKIIAQGNVKINQNDRMATCVEATFFQPSQKIVLTGKPKVWQGNNIITGEKITILLIEDKMDIEGGKQNRVNATIYPMGKNLK